MRKFVRTYSPFLVYFVCVALAYFLCFYLFPKYNAALAYLGFLIIYTYIDIGVFILGFFMGKIIVKRSIDISFLLCLIYALISFGLRKVSLHRKIPLLHGTEKVIHLKHGTLIRPCSLLWLHL